MSQSWNVVLDTGEVHTVSVVPDDSMFRAEWLDSDAYGGSARLAVIGLVRDNRWPAVEILAPKKSSKLLTAPTSDGIWIPVLNGVPCEPVQIRHLHITRGIAHYDVMSFGWDIPGSAAAYKGYRWLKYTPPLVAKK